jgi:hypothetical protein
MIVSSVIRGALLVACAVFTILGWMSVFALIAIAFLVGTMDVLFDLADFTLLPSVVAEAQLPSANAAVTAADSGIGIAGSGVGGTLVQLVTAPVAVVLNGLCYLLSAGLLARLRVTEPPPEANDGSSVLREALAGIRILFRNRVMRALVFEATLWNIGDEIYILAVTVIILGRSSSGPLALGVVFMCGAIGAFVGAAFSARLSRWLGYGRGLVVALLLGNSAPLVGLLFATDSSVRSLTILGAAYLVSGFGLGTANSQATTVRQLAVRPEVRGRANASYRLLSWGVLPLGALLAGWLTTVIPVWTAGVIGATLVCLATVPVVLSPIPRMVKLSDQIE